VGDRRDLPRNTLLSDARRRLRSPSGSGRTLSRQELADAVNTYQWHTHQVRDRITDNDIGKLERGEHRWPSRTRREAFRAVLGAATDAALGFYITRTDRGQTDDAVALVESVLHQPDQSESTGGGTSPDRMIGSRLNDAAPAGGGWAGMLRHTQPCTPLILANIAGIDPAHPVDVDGPLDREMVQGLCSAAAHYRRAYQAVSASRLLPAALAHLELVLSLRPASRREPDRTPLVTAAGEMAALAGVLLGLDASRHDEALSYLDVAWSAARSVGNVELQAVVLGCRSFCLAHGNGDHRAGLECADFARSVGKHGACPRTRGWVAAVASERCASLGDVAGCQQRLDESRAALDSGDLQAPSWRGIGGYDNSKLRAYEGGDLMRLRRYHEAQTVLDDALGRLDVTMSRHRATALLDRAEARLGLGDADAACADATDSLRLVTHVEHTGHLDRIQTLAVRATATGSSAARTLSNEVLCTYLDHGLPIGR